MLYEQAFHHLPEVLHGSGYHSQSYEAGIVGAYSLALLQCLNGRNVRNPISCIVHEKPYSLDPSRAFKVGAKTRYLRADLHLNSKKLLVATEALEQYAWRHYNWLEAKFMRGQSDGESSSSNSTTHTALLIADLIRLSILAPCGKKSRTGRYLLHVYDAEPGRYLTLKKRSYLKRLLSAGSQELDLGDLSVLPAGFKKHLGDLSKLRLCLNVTNYILDPVSHVVNPRYWMILTRIDGIYAELDSDYLIVDTDGTRIMSSSKALESIRAYVVERIGIPEGSGEDTPKATDILPSEDDEEKEDET